MVTIHQAIQAAAAAKSLQLCLTLCNLTRLLCPWDSPGKNTGVGCHLFLQCMKGKVKVKSFSRVRLLATPWTAVYQAPLSMGVSRREYWSGVPLPPLDLLKKLEKNVNFLDTFTSLPK